FDIENHLEKAIPEDERDYILDLSFLGIKKDYTKQLQKIVKNRINRHTCSLSRNSCFIKNVFANRKHFEGFINLIYKNRDNLPGDFDLTYGDQNLFPPHLMCRTVNFYKIYASTHNFSEYYFVLPSYYRK
ncbi:MAG: hypothetical protein JXR56_00485, partial [Candidatus Cloacimonetes bacterium]|nr:hypothetical protein [Candidatus Cloacimonadota bacterium]